MVKRKTNYAHTEDVDSGDDKFFFRIVDGDLVADFRKQRTGYCSDSSNIDSSDSDSDVIAPSKKRKITKLSSRSASTNDERGKTEEENLTADFNYQPFDTWQQIFEEDNIPPRFEFSTGKKIPGPQINNLDEPIQYFNLFFTDTLIENIILQTNLYAKRIINDKKLSKYSIWNDWYDVTIEEMKPFLGVILNTGTIYINNIEDYWSTGFETKVPFFGEIFSRKRFLQIFWMLHLNENAPRTQDIKTRIQKVNNYIEYLDSKFREHFVPGREISVDESVVKFKGRISFITYNPNKPPKWGIRIYVLADAKCGYIYSVLPYYGSLTSQYLIKPELPLSARIVLHLYNKILQSIPDGVGYHIYTDSYYTSLILAKELLQIKCHITGTIQKNRKHIPKAISNPKFIHTNTVAYRHSNYLLLAWKDKRIVTMLSTYHTTGSRNMNKFLRTGNTQEVSKPNVIADYTERMGGVDKADQYATTYCFLRKSLKWWRKLFFWGLETSVINAYILYRLSEERKGKRYMSHYKFVKLLVKQLVGDFRKPSSRGRPSTTDKQERLNGKLHIINQLAKGKKKKCLVCSTKGSQPKIKQTVFYCETCERQPGLHPNECFKKYHTLKDYN